MTDARIRYTKMVIKQTFVALLQIKPLNKITVKEICEKADINRATFYKYYQDVYDLLDKIEDEILHDIKKMIAFDENKSIKQTLTELLYKMKESDTIFRTLFSNYGDPHFTDKLFTLGHKELFNTIYKYNKSYNTYQQNYLYVYVAKGSSGIIQQWSQNGMVEDPEVIASFIDELIANTLKKQPQ